MSTLSFKNVNKIYENKVQAVYDFNLEVSDKEFIVFVGPSGCGKSTTLRMIAGLEDISSGEIYIDDTLINNVAPKDRNIAMVFQNYALYPHMTVFDNMAFALKLRKAMFPVFDKDGNRVLTYDHAKVDEMYKELSALEEQKPMDKVAVEAKRDEIEKFKEIKDQPAFELRHYTKAELAEKVNAAAEILGLEPYLKRKPAALSGGQRQRVALGRAIVRNPKVFLMDEPLSNLDAKLRVQMRSEISKIHQTVGATTIYVTHDQTEAMTMATRIVCMKDGYIQQIGTPKELFNTPANMFVAGFIGSPAMNFIRGTFDGEMFHASCDDGTCIDIELPNDKRGLLSDYINKELVLGVRPEDIYVAGDINNKHPYGKPLDLKCDISELLGRELVIYSLIGSQRIIIKTTNQDDVEQGTVRSYSFDMDAVHFFDPETTMRIVK